MWFLWCHSSDILRGSRWEREPSSTFPISPYQLLLGAEVGPSRHPERRDRSTGAGKICGDNEDGVEIFLPLVSTLHPPRTEAPSGKTKANGRAVCPRSHGWEEVRRLQPTLIGPKALAPCDG